MWVGKHKGEVTVHASSVASFSVHLSTCLSQLLLSASNLSSSWQDPSLTFCDDILWRFPFHQTNNCTRVKRCVCTTTRKCLFCAARIAIAIASKLIVCLLFSLSDAETAERNIERWMQAIDRAPAAALAAQLGFPSSPSACGGESGSYSCPPSERSSRQRDDSTPPLPTTTAPRSTTTP